MVSFQINKDTTEIARESYKGEIKSVFWSTKTVSVICAKFQVILWEFANFQKFRQKKKW